MLNSEFNQVGDLTVHAPPLGQAHVATLQLICTYFPCRGPRNDVFAFFEWPMSGGVKNRLAGRGQDLAKRQLVLALVRANQPVFYYSREQPMPLAFLRELRLHGA
jgi:hypothetical protein